MAKYEVSRHFSTLRATAARDFPGVNFDGLCFVVDFATNPPSIWFERPTESERTMRGTIIEEIFTRARGKGAIVMKIKPLCDLFPEKCFSFLRLVHFDTCQTDIMGTSEYKRREGRAPCRIGHRQSDTVKAEYDVLDELSQRVSNVYPSDPYAPDYDVLTEVIRDETRKLLQGDGATARDLIFV